MEKFILEKTEDGRTVIVHYIQGHRFEEYDTEDPERMLAFNLLKQEAEQIEIITRANRRNW